MLADGFYALVYNDGQYRIFRVKTPDHGGLAGKTIIGFKVGTKFPGFGFLLENNGVRFWKRFANTQTDVRLTRIRRAVELVCSNPKKAQQAYAIKEKRCARCNRQLTVPASLHAGLGPECAGKGRWTQADNQLAFNAQEQKAVAADPKKSFFGRNPARRTA